MPSVEKIIEKMKRQPNGIRPEEADKVLRGLRLRRSKTERKPQTVLEQRDRRPYHNQTGKPIKEGVHSRHT